MNGNEMLDILGKIDPKLVKQTQKPPVIRWIALAACLALVIGITAMLLHPGSLPTPSNPVLQAPTEPSPTVPSVPTTSSVPTIPTYTTTPPPETTLPTQTTPTTPPTYEELYRQLFREYYRTRPYGQPDDVQPIVDELLRKYNLYQLTSVFCDYEYVYDDMSEYLSDRQKEDYDHFQYRITCCQSAEEIHAHTARFLDPSLIDRTPDKRLFRDGEGKLHLMVTPTGDSGYHAFYVMNCSDTQMIVFAEEGYDEYDESAIILLELQNDTWLIRSILPFDNHDNVESYRYLFEEIPADVDPQAYGMLLSDALFVNPDSFLKQLYTQNRETVLSIADLMYHTAIDPLLYQRLLDVLDDRTDLTAEQRSALAMLQSIS